LLRPGTLDEDAEEPSIAGSGVDADATEVLDEITAELLKVIGRPHVHSEKDRAGLPGHPPIHHVESQQHSDDDPPRLAGRSRIFFRDVVPTIGATLRLLVNRTSTMRTRNYCVPVPVVLVIIPLVFVHGQPFYWWF
jgi:hypothetical protein